MKPPSGTHPKSGHLGHGSAATHLLGYYRRMSPIGISAPPVSAPADTPSTRPWSAECPNKRGLTVVNQITGEVHPARCYRHYCFACLPLVALRIGAAIAAARPFALVTFTGVGDDWPTVRCQMNRVRRVLRRTYDFKDAFTVEPNPRLTGHHVHLWWRGDAPSEWQLREAATAVGLGFEVDVTARGTIRNGAYGFKAVIDSPVGATALWPQAEQFLAMNGGRLVHPSRGFWLDAQGRPVTLREAIREDRRERSKRSGPYRLRPVSSRSQSGPGR